MAEGKAEGKRSVAGKVATPKTGATPATSSAPPMMDHLEGLGKSIGARIKITTVAPHSLTYEGTLFTYCPVLHIVAIDTRNASDQTTSATVPQPGNYRMFPEKQIQSVQLLARANGGDAGSGTLATAQPAIRPLDIKRLEQRMKAKIKKLKEEERDNGKGVSKEAQAIFDSLKRINVPIRWHNQEMIAHDAIIISPPYRGEDCKGSQEKQEVLNRVKRVLEGERKKLKEKEDRDRKAATPVGPRKGG